LSSPYKPCPIKLYHGRVSRTGSVFPIARELSQYKFSGFAVKPLKRRQTIEPMAMHVTSPRSIHHHHHCPPETIHHHHHCPPDSPWSWRHYQEHSLSNKLAVRLDTCDMINVMCLALPAQPSHAEGPSSKNVFTGVLTPTVRLATSCTRCDGRSDSPRNHM